MSIFTKIYKYYLVIILFNLFLSLSINDSIEISENILTNINLNESSPKNFTFNIDTSKGNYISLFSLSGVKFNMAIYEFNLTEIDTTSFQKEINSTNGSFITINLSSKENNTIEIIIVKNETKYKYFEIKNEDQNYKINNYYNFVKFLDDDKRIKVEIKDLTVKGLCHCGIVQLATNNISFIPPVTNFKYELNYENNYTISDKFDFEIGTIKYDDENPKENSALICSIETDKEIKEYTVIINKDIMNKFLISSIIIALIFAIITFFLIRRKQNITKSIEDDYYEEKTEEEDKEN